MGLSSLIQNLHEGRTARLTSILGKPCACESDGYVVNADRTGEKKLAELGVVSLLGMVRH
jgi:hypothetical protein